MEQLRKLKKRRLQGILLSLFGIPSSVMSLGVYETASGAFALMISIFILAVGLIMFFWSRETLKHYCQKCGASMKGAKYRYEAIGRDKNFTTVHYEGTCTECGYLNEFTKKFLNSNSNLDFVARKTAERYFR